MKTDIAAGAVNAVRAAGDSHPGLQREVNEDRFHIDVARGLYMVVDGVGGQAAGGKAADVAVGMLRARLERETGSVADRVREAITVANNEVCRIASLRSEWHGMACVLTVAVVDDGRAVVGHVGDTRLYKLRRGRIEKVTRDHSPVGEREDARELSESQAMRHPRRNEVYRDVGSEHHDAHDAEFIDLHDVPFEPDAALLLCSDGLTDLVDSATIADVAARCAGRPRDVVGALIDAANDAGGKDNVTIVYVEGESFAAAASRAAAREPFGEPSARVATTSVLGRDDRNDQSDEKGQRGASTPAVQRGRLRRTVVRAATVLLIAIVIGYAAYRSGWRVPLRLPQAIATLPAVAGPIVVFPSDSIAAALTRARPGDVVIVEPGEYRERLVLSNGVRVVSRVPRGATIRLPSAASEQDPAVVADGISDAELTGFRIVGDAATPLGIGISSRGSNLSVVDVEVTGAAYAAVEFDAARGGLVASHVHDNPGAALTVRGGSAPRVSQNVFSRNGLSERVGAALVIDPDAQATFFGNVFQGVGADAFRALGEATAARATRDNWFVDGRDAPARQPGGARGRHDR